MNKNSKLIVTIKFIISSAKVRIFWKKVKRKETFENSFGIFFWF